jgi:hypothetical protein
MGPMLRSPQGADGVAAKLRLERKYSHLPSGEKAGSNDS